MIVQFGPLLAAMLVLLVGSAFFSSSEAALFYLTRDDRERFVHGNRAQKRVVHLLSTPERLLTSILFWNLVINVGYFSIASRIGLALERDGHASAAAGFTVGALLTIILCSEMLPKNLAVLWPRWLSTAVSLPLSASIWALMPVLPTLQAINRISLRTLLPNFEREAYLELRDIERAISLSTPDKTMAHHEELVLHQIVSLSEMEAEELMRPRLGLTFYHAPVSMNDLRENPPNCDYLLVAEPDSEEFDRAMPLSQLSGVTTNRLETECERVPYVPWCATGAATLDVLSNSRGGLAVVINELGETIGIVTLDDVMHALFANPTIRVTSRSAAQSIEPLPDSTFELNGAITLRRLAKQLNLELPTAKSVTVAGMLQENLQRLPQPGDEVLWGNCRFLVTDSPRPGVLTATVEKLPEQRRTDDVPPNGGGI
nr:CNNM domain-containing protein [Aeoliella straminimaris]